MDWRSPIPLYSLVCTFCRHQTDYRSCAAFPDTIPMEIWAGLNTHEQPYPGDHGIRFESVPGAKITTPQEADSVTIRLLREQGLLPPGA